MARLQTLGLLHLTDVTALLILFEDLFLMVEARIVYSLLRNVLWLVVNLSALCHLGQDAVVLNVIGVVGLNVSGETVKRALECVLGSRVHHAGVLCLLVGDTCYGMSLDLPEAHHPEPS